MAKDFPAAFARLREMLQKHATGLPIVTDTPKDFIVTSPACGPNGKPMWFGAVKLGKSAVSFHLMPLYFNPKLGKQISAELQKRKQGKSCFNFQGPDEALFAQLDELTGTARGQWERYGFLKPGQITTAMMGEALRASGVDVDALAKVRAQKGKEAAGKRAATLRSKKARS
jgi:hypothetical protein